MSEKSLKKQGFNDIIYALLANTNSITEPIMSHTRSSAEIPPADGWNSRAVRSAKDHSDTAQCAPPFEWVSLKEETTSGNDHSVEWI